MMKQGTLGDAIIEASNSTKHKRGERAPERYQTKKGNQWYFGLKAHIFVDAKSGLTHSLVTTAAKEHDLNQVGHLLPGKEEFVFADAGYQGVDNSETLAIVKVEWEIAIRPSKLKELKSSIRAKIGHPFRIIKRQFGFVKARLKRLCKNDNQLAILFTLANLFRVGQMIRAWDSWAQNSR